MAIRNKNLVRLILTALCLPAGFLISHLLSPHASKPASAAATAATDGPPLAPEKQVHAQYAGSASCRECHEDASAKWARSNHGLAERPFSLALDEKAFSPKLTFTQRKEVSETFLDATGHPHINTRGLDKQTHDYPVERIIGNNPLRQFLIAAPGNRLQTCDVSFDPNKNELFNVYGAEERNPGDWGHWTGQGMNWNAMCAACHNTRLRKNYDPQANSYHTTMAEMSVGCEACHGPMKDHVVWQKNKPSSGAPKDPTLHKFSRDQMFDTCGACHARRGEISGDLIPGSSFPDHFSLTITDDSDIYYPDGQVRDEDYEYASFLSSRMHQSGIRCVDCHDPHTAKRYLPGNLLCMRCHGGGTKPLAPIIDPVSHSHHKADSTGNECTACHMPITPYMQRHPRHDHGMTIPDPQLTVDFGVPNACSRCHTDKDPAWAVKTATGMYGAKLNRPTHSRAVIVARARRGDPSARADLLQLLKTEVIPSWQATCCHLLDRWAGDPEVTRALLEQLKNTSPLVREAATRSLTHLLRPAPDQTNGNHDEVAKALTSLLDDPFRSVRVAAAWALVTTVDLSSRPGRELCHMLDLNSDQPTGRMQLSQFAYLRGDTPAAIRQMRKAIAWDPNSPPFHHDLAILLNSTGETRSAINALLEAIRLAPNEAEYHYKLGLAWNEAGEIDKAAVSLATTVRLDPSRARAWYNLGLAHNALQQPQQAIADLLKGEAADPNDPAIPYARATIHARFGQREEAIAAATRALQIRQNFPDALDLIRSLAK